MKKDTRGTTEARFSDLLGLMAHLRSPEGCPWDRAQDHRSLRRCLLEEAHEVLQAIDSGEPADLCRELGDLLLQVVFHAQLAAEAGEFGIDDVIRGLHDKLVERHPHVFGDKSLETPEEVVEEWESLKGRKRGRTPAEQMAKMPSTLPALARAQAAQRHGARAGVGLSREQARGALEEALAELAAAPAGDPRAEQAVGALLFAAVGLARAHQVDAEQALRERVDEFVDAARGTGRAGAGGHSMSEPSEARDL